MSKEIWKDVPNYEGLYQVSNLGNVKSLRKDKILRCKNYSNYNGVILYDGSHKAKTMLIHRLVAQAFIPNIDNLPCINHKDENKKNNNVENLEWCSYKYNNNYGNHNKNNSLAHCKKIYQYKPNGVFIKEWASQIEIQKTLGINQRNISSCCKKTRKTAGGYIWIFKEECNEQI